MKYFTWEWASGGLSDDTWRQTLDSYQKSLTLFDRDEPISRFAATVSLNDAYLDRIDRHRVTGRLQLLLLTGDLQVGYWRTSLTYSGAQIIGEEALRAGLSRRPSEIWYDEFEMLGERRRHGFLLAPAVGQGLGKSAGEFAIIFDDFHYCRTPASARSLTTLEDCSVWV